MTKKKEMLFSCIKVKDGAVARLFLGDKCFDFFVFYFMLSCCRVCLLSNISERHPPNHLCSKRSDIKNNSYHASFL